jgi:HEAT repeat protein
VQAVEDNSNHKAAVIFLIKVAQSEPDREIRRTAVEAFDDHKDSRHIQVLARVIDDSGADRELRRTALDAVGSGEGKEAPLLMRIAKSHANTEMRVQAVEQLAAAPISRRARCSGYNLCSPRT